MQCEMTITSEDASREFSSIFVSFSYLFFSLHLRTFLFRVKHFYIVPSIFWNIIFCRF